MKTMKPMIKMYFFFFSDSLPVSTSTPPPHSLPVSTPQPPLQKPKKFGILIIGDEDGKNKELGEEKFDECIAKLQALWLQIDVKEIKK